MNKAVETLHGFCVLTVHSRRAAWVADIQMECWQMVCWIKFMSSDADQSLA